MNRPHDDDVNAELDALVAMSDDPDPTMSWLELALLAGLVVFSTAVIMIVIWSVS